MSEPTNDRSKGEQGKLTDKTVLVTGGAGFIGSAVVAQLLERNTGQVLVLDNMVRGRPDNLASVAGTKELEIVEGDIRDSALMEGLIGRSNAIIHLAALRIRHCIEQPQDAFDVMYAAPFSMLRSAIDHGVERIVVASSSSIYGMADVFPTDEFHHPYSDRTLYGAGKLAVEGMLRSFRDTHGLRYAALRPFNVYGPKMDTHGAYTEVMVRWMQRIKRGEAPLVFGDGSQAFDFTYVDDAARAFVLALEATEVEEGAFNVGTGISTSLGELAATMIRKMESSVEIEYLEGNSAATDVTRRQADTQKAARALGFRAEVPLDLGMERLVEWSRSKPDHD